jgi:uncharacterized membrane protein
MLRIAEHPRSHTVVVSIARGLGSTTEAMEILIDLSVCSQNVLGKNRVGIRDHNIANGWTPFDFLLIVLACLGFRVCLWVYLKRRRHLPLAQGR